jgi:NTE family protein
MRLSAPSEPRLLLRSLVPPWRARPLLAVAALQRRGEVPTALLGDRIRRAHDRDWPEQPTWITAVRLRDGARVVFGRDVTDADLATAVEASSAIPGYFTPVRHRDETYVDGGAHSPTNADLVAGAGFDVVVVSSPMSGTRQALRPLRLSSGRALHTATLAREVRAVRAAGTPVLVLHPGPEVVAAIGNRSMDASCRRAVARAALDTVRAHLASGRVDDRLALLRS